MTRAEWTVVFSTDATADLILIEDHLAQAYMDFGEGPDEARLHAAQRVDALITTAERLATAPFRGETSGDLLPDLRHLMLDRAVYWFVPDSAARQVRVLAIFFGAQDHQRHMLVRLLDRGRK
jgi:plasmid stabilization system protein ParE